MTWSYSDPSKTIKDRVRFLIGDTDTNEQLLSDEEITFLIGEYPNPDEAAYQGCLSVLAKLARNKNMSVGKTNISWSDQYTHYQDLAKQLYSKFGDTPIAYYASSENEPAGIDPKLPLDRDFSYEHGGW